MNPDQISERLRRIVGESNVLTSPEDRELHSRCTIPWDKECAAVVYPGSIQDVQEIVRLANEGHFPIWVFSRGKNWGYGTKCALQENAVILVLERLNTIEDVNQDLAYAVLGAGVSYGELNTYLKERHIKLWADCTDSTPDGSVIGNALERGLGYTEYGDHFGSLCGMEIVLPTGELIRTGGGPENFRSFHTYKYGLGPYSEGLFSQSNLGIVVKAGVWLMPEPESFCCFVCEIKDPDAYPTVMDSIRRLSLAKVISSNIHMPNTFVAMALAMPYPKDRLGGKTYLDPDQLNCLRRELGLASWIMSGALYGPRRQVDAHRRIIQKEFSPYGRVSFFDDARIRLVSRLVRFLKSTAHIPGLNTLGQFLKNRFISKSPDAFITSLEKIYPIFKGIPGTYSLNLAYVKHPQGRPPGHPDPARDRCGLMWFAPIAPMHGPAVQSLMRLCEPLFEKHGFEFAVTFSTLNSRSVIVLMSIFFDRSNPEETKRAERLYDDLSQTTEKEGFAPYRTSLASMQGLFKNAPGFHLFANRIKKALDPRGILSPGRYGMDGNITP